MQRQNLKGKFIPEKQGFNHKICQTAPAELRLEPLFRLIFVEMFGLKEVFKTCRRVLALTVGILPLQAVSSTNDPLCAIPGVDRPQTAGTQRMVARLKEILEAVDPQQNRFATDKLIARLQQVSSSALPVAQLVQAKAELALELIRDNRNEEALRELAALASFAARNRVGFNADQRSYLRMAQAQAFLRMGERDNCLSNHTSDSCLLPIAGNGVHRNQTGSRKAIEVLKLELEAKPRDLAARWLLNIAYQTVGDYPDKVPTQYLIPPPTYASEFPLQKFPDVAPAVGLDIENNAGGVVTEDFDGDGDLDVLMSSWLQDGQLRYFRNRGDGTFEERTREAGLIGLYGGLNMMQADFDNDGKVDVFIVRGAWLGKGGHHPNSLLRGNGDGTFDDVTEAAGMLSFHPTQTAAWLDYDGDGWLDLFIGNESSPEDPNPSELYHNNKDGTFTECAAQAGVTTMAFVKGVVSADFNNDCKPDLYVSCQGADNILFRNEGGSAGTNWHFVNIAKEAGVTEPLYSFSTFAFDYDNDGNQDIFVCGYRIRDVGDVAADYLGVPTGAERARLYRNNGDGTFTDASMSVGLNKVIHGMGINFGDLDNDGWLDFYVGTGDPDLLTLIPNRMFRNAHGKFFQEVTSAGGFGHLQKGHAISFADLDNDGDQDVFAMMGGAYRGDFYRDALFNNPGIATNHWVNLRLEGRGSNRAAIGARIKVTVSAANGKRVIHRTVGSGGSFGASSLRQEIGLENAAAIESVEIVWPKTGKTQKITDLQMDQFYKIVEDASAAELLSPARFKLAAGAAASANHHSHGPAGHNSHY